MSAFVVSHDHIDALVTFAAIQKLRYRADNRIIYITSDNATETGAILLQENTRSVLNRYPNDTEATCPGREGESVDNYKFHSFDQIERLPQHKLVGLILTACSCFDYQACETNDYEESTAYQIIDAIRTEAIRMVPKYDAPWEITRDQFTAFASKR
jgi:hypothetical protein